MHQVEFYLSEGNLAHDRFFAEQMKNRPDNGIPIAMLLQCNRLQALKINEELLLRSIRKSSLVKVSEDGLAVVRTRPLAELAPREKRTILVVGIPRWFNDPNTVDQSLQEQAVDGPDPTVNTASFSTPHTDRGYEMMDWLRDIFSEYGEVLYISLPQYHTSGFFRGFAFVEFATPKQARLAVKSMAPAADDESWFVAPLAEGSCPPDTPLPENAWKPRLAARTALLPSDMLERRYVWRCCSRKNKQIQIAFRHLRSAGYRAPNPCDREYEQITLGASSPEIRAEYIKESYGEPHRDKLRVIRYAVWEFWKSKFYLWLNAWVERMRRKTDELSMNLETAQLDVDEHNDRSDGQATDNQVSQVIHAANSPTENSQTQANSLSLGLCTSLPKNYVPSTVILLFWPSKLVQDSEQTVLSSVDDDPTPKPHLSLARRIRISLEHNLLSACSLLEQVAHMDPHPNDLVLSEVLSSLDKHTSLSSRSSVENTYAVFIRMKTRADALTLAQFAADLKSPVGPIKLHLLSGPSETAYCKAISASLTGAAERRRRLQFKRRQRKKTESSGTQRDDVPTASTKNRADLSETVPLEKRSKHIVFDE
ncbi:hypothetical protein T265_07793 [Opisthorchis viverrini]|uniref:La-related protein 7 n=1 Tax=Opisthorchis viverrini TaxID=6198 RepID=A0A074ZBT6_OPIVI|nr:hypothetical protein T265_07793 [Opisthorchis viverrini]KER24603.1 hypothetical protein T265_07793 [Opisthorchis viverrini]